MYSLFVTLLIIFSCIGYGALLKWLFAGMPMLMQLGSGIWLLAHLVFIAGLTGLLNSVVLWALLYAGVIIYCIRLYANKADRPRLKEFVALCRSLNTIERLGWLVLGVPAVSALIGAASPPVHRDSLVYHLALPKLYLANGQWYEIPHNIYNYFPGLTESLYTLALGLGSQYPALIHFSFGLACLAATYKLGQYLGLQRRFLILSLIGLSATPTFWSEMTWAYVDLVNTFFWLLTVSAFLHWCRDKKTVWLVLLGFFMGAAYCCKYTSLLLFILVPLGILLELRQDENVSLAAVVKSLGIPTLLGVLAASPWWFRNLFLTNNPFFPFFWNFFPSTSMAWDGERTTKFSLLLETYGGVHKGLIDYLLAPFRVFIEAEINKPYQYDGKLGWYYLLSLPLVLFWKRLPGSVRYIVGLILVYFIYWAFSSQQARFLLVVLPLMSLLIGYLLQTIQAHFAGSQKMRKSSGTGKNAALLWVGTVLLAIGINGVDTFAIFRQEHYLDYWLGNVSRKEYLQSKLPYYPMYQFIDSHLPENVNLFLVTTGNQGYYLERRFYSDAVFEHHTLLQILSKAGSAQEMLDICRQRGWSHLLIRLDYFVKNLGPDFQGLRTKKFNAFLATLKLIHISGPFYLFAIPPKQVQEVN